MVFAAFTRKPSVDEAVAVAEAIACSATQMNDTKPSSAGANVTAMSVGSIVLHATPITSDVSVGDHDIKPVAWPFLLQQLQL